MALRCGIETHDDGQHGNNDARETCDLEETKNFYPNKDSR